MLKPPTLKALIYVSLGIAAGLLIYSVVHMQQWNQTSQEIFLLQKTEISGQQGDDIPQAIQLSNAYLAYKQGKYLQAVQYLTGQKDTDYYNRGVLYMMQAYQQGMQSDFSGVSSANQWIAMAQEDFLLASKLSQNPRLHQLAQDNENKVDQMQTIILSKSCYAGGEETINLFSGLQSKLKDTLDTLQQEQSLFSKNKGNLPSACQQQWTNMFTTSTQNISTLQDITKEQGAQELSKLQEKIDNPALCLSGANEGLIHSLQATQEAIASFTHQHQDNLPIRKDSKNNTDALCQRDKNDGQINQSLQAQLQDLMQHIGSSQTNKSVNTQPSYTPINAKDQELLENINKKNKLRIRQIQRLKNEKTYDGFPYIQSLFNSFYGNSGDFQSNQ